MSLILGLFEGKDFYVGNMDTRVKVYKILGTHSFVLEVQVKIKRWSSELFTITDEKSQEILPGVHVICGTRGTLDLARVLIHAPGHIKILRGDIVRQKFVHGEEGSLFD